MLNRSVYVSRTLGVAAGLLLSGSLVAVPAMAATITYNFSGNVTGVGSLLSPPPPPFSTSAGPSSAMSGSMTVNTTDTASGGVNGSYSIQSFNVTIGSYTAVLGPSGVVNIRNGSGGGPGADRFEVTVNSPTGNNVNFLVPRLFEIGLRGPSSLLGSDALPSSVPSVSSFNNQNQFRLVFGPTGGAGQRTVSGVLSSLTAVPLPASVILFGVGLVALIGLGAGGLRNIRLPQV
jgi:hypothetical protein